MSVNLCSICKLSTQDDLIGLHEDGTIVHQDCLQIALDAIKQANPPERKCWGCDRVITVQDEVTSSDEGGLWHPPCLIKSK